MALNPERAGAEAAALVLSKLLEDEDLKKTDVANGLAKIIGADPKGLDALAKIIGAAAAAAVQHIKDNG